LGFPSQSQKLSSCRKIRKVILSFTLRDLPPSCSYQNEQRAKDQQAVSVEQREVLSMPLCVWENEFKPGLNLWYLMCYREFCLETLHVKPKAEFTSERGGKDNTPCFQEHPPLIVALRSAP